MSSSNANIPNVTDKATRFMVQVQRFIGFASQWMADMVIIGFLILVSIGHIRFYQNFDNYPKALIAGTLGMAALIVLAFKYLRRNAPLGHPRKLKIILLISAFALGLSLIGLFYSLVFSVDLVGDFARYWKLAGQFADGESPKLQSPYHSRAWMGLSPFVEVFGYKPLAFKAANAIYLFVSFSAAGWLTYRIAGLKAAKIALLCSFLCFGPIAWTVYPTHDLPGSAVFMAGIVYIVEVCRWSVSARNSRRILRIITILIASLLMGALLSWMYFIKSFLPFYLAGGLLGMFVGWRSAPETKLSKKTKLVTSVLRSILIILPVVVSALIHVSFLDVKVRSVVAQSASDGTNFWIAAHTNSLGTGRYTPDIRYVARPYRTLLARDDAQNMNLMIANAVDDPIGSLSLRVEKASQLMTMSTSIGFVAMPSIRVDDKDTRTVNVTPVMAFVGQLFSLLLITSLIVIILSPQIIRRRSAIIIAPLFVFACALIILGQVQSRYMMQIWFIGLVLIGVAASCLPDIKQDLTKGAGALTKSRIISLGRVLILTFVAGAIFTVLVVQAANVLYDFEDGRPVDLRSNATTPLGGTFLSPYLIESSGLPLFGTRDMISVTIPGSLHGEKLVAWAHAELSSSEKKCSTTIQPFIDGVSVGKPVNLKNKEAQRLYFRGAKKVVFEFQKSCDLFESKDPYIYEVGFIRKVAQTR